jgi:hypothetical protein
MVIVIIMELIRIGLIIKYVLDSYLEGTCSLAAVYDQLSALGWSNNRITLVTTAIMPQWGFSDN